MPPIVQPTDRSYGVSRVRVDFGVEVRMGVRVNATVYRASEFLQPTPVIVTMTQEFGGVRLGEESVLDLGQLHLD